MKKISTILCLSLLTTLLSSSVLAQSISFSDVSSQNLKSDAIDYLQSEGVIEGYNDGTFKPNNRINRAEFTKIIIASLYSEEEINACLDSTDLSYPDIDQDAWYSPFICIATKENIVAGYPDGTFRPSSNINFAESSKIISNSFGLEFTLENESEDLWYAEFIHDLEASSAIPSTIDSPEIDLTRGDMSEMVYRLKADIQDKPTQTLSNLTNQIGTINSCDALSERFKQFNYPTYYLSEPFFMEDNMDFEFLEESVGAPAPVSSDIGGLSEETKIDFSETNIQEQGVDEPDVVKTDGTHIYTVNSNYRSPAVQITKANGDTIELESSILFNDSTPSGLFIKDNKLIVLANSNYYDYYPFALTPETDISILDGSESIIQEPVNSENLIDFEVSNEALSLPAFRDDSQMSIYVFDVTQPASPSLLRKVEVEGSYRNARLIDDQLLFVSSYYPYNYDFDEITGEDLLPQVAIDGGEFEPAVECTDIKYLPNHSDTSFVTISSLDISSETSTLSSEVIIASTDSLYVSPNNMYLTQPRYNYDWFADFDSESEGITTNIFKFEIDETNLSFQSVMSVPGTPLNQFSMSEYNGDFRITTTLEDWSDWSGENSTNNLYVFDENSNMIGSLEDLAKGERIYSTRFIGDRAYMVTFRQIDPFFVIDLSDSTQPTVLGELKIPGFSDYLHPYDENHILGFGQDADLNGRAKGMKVALFNVEDPSNPTQMHTYQIGDEGTYSDLLYNHRALLFSKSKDIMAFPVAIYEKPESESWGQLSFNGALNLSLDLEDGFEVQGKYSHLSEEINPDAPWEINYDEEIKRLIYIEDNLYTISNQKIQSHPLSSDDTINSIDLIK